MHVAIIFILGNIQGEVIFLKSTMYVDFMHPVLK